MNIATALLMALALPSQNHGTAASAAESKSERLLKQHTEDAASFTFYRDSGRQQKLVLRPEPIYRWTNPTRVGGQVGEVYVWTYRGRPDVVGSIFSHPAENQSRCVCHELHSLSLSVLTVTRDSVNQWTPQAAGVELKVAEGAPEPADSASKRLAQMRTLAREFSGRSRGDSGESWTLRLLPQPLYRFESSDPDVIDGALFALVSDAGTDPEIILDLEARKTGAGIRWVFGAARFSDMSLWLNHKNQEVWTSIRGPLNTFNYDEKHRFRFYQDRFVPESYNEGAR